MGHEGKSGPQVSGRTAGIFLFVLLIVAVVIVIAGIVPRVRARTTLKNDTDAIAAPDVTAEKPKMGTPDEEVIVPGNIFAFTDSPIYARTSGYLDKWYYDIGAHVRKGALLATISSPGSGSAVAAGACGSCDGAIQCRLRADQCQAVPGPAAIGRSVTAGHGKFHDTGEVKQHCCEVGAGKCTAAGSTDVFREDLRAVRWGDHVEGCGYWNADRFRSREGVVPHGAHRYPARLHQYSADLCCGMRCAEPRRRWTFPSIQGSRLPAR